MFMPMLDLNRPRRKWGRPRVPALENAPKSHLPLVLAYLGFSLLP